MLPTKAQLGQRKYVAALLGLAIGLIVLLAGSLASVEFLPGEALPLAALIESLQGNPVSFSGVALPGSVFYLLAGGLWALLIISVIAFVISPEVRRETIKRVIRYTIIILLLHGIIRLLPPFITPEEVAEPPQAADLLDDVPPEPLPSPPEFVVNPPEWIIGGVTLALLAALLLVMWLLWRRFFKPRPATPLEQLTRKVQQTLIDIEAGADLKDTVLCCYGEMSRLFSRERGLDRRQGMTPREFEQFLAGSGLDDEHIRRLTRLFERVRYSARTPGYDEEQEAVACLSAIVQTYGRPS